MEKAARPIIIAFICFLVMTYVVCMHEYEAFLLCLMKGVIVDIVIIPLLYMEYGDESKYRFTNLSKKNF